MACLFDMFAYASNINVSICVYDSAVTVCSFVRLIVVLVNSKIFSACDELNIAVNCLVRCLGARQSHLHTSKGVVILKGQRLNFVKIFYDKVPHALKGLV